LREEQSSAVTAVEDIQEAAEQIKAEGKSKPRKGRHAVNQPMVDHWLDAIGDRNPIYTDDAAAKAAGHPGVVAPPAMIQVWTMAGLGGVRADDDPLSKIMRLFDDNGYVGVVATNCEQTYHRYLRPGDEVSVAAELTDVVGGTEKMRQHVMSIEKPTTFLVATEAAMIHPLQKAAPQHTYIPVPGITASTGETCACNRCPHMSRNTLQKVRDCLKNGGPEIEWKDYFQQARAVLDKSLLK
jgi:acyl dehydratase